jgi:hypothetical protein
MYKPSPDASAPEPPPAEPEQNEAPPRSTVIDSQPWCPESPEIWYRAWVEYVDPAGIFLIASIAEGNEFRVYVHKSTVRPSVRLAEAGMEVSVRLTNSRKIGGRAKWESLECNLFPGN